MANMSLWGVTEHGFYRPTVEDIINEKNKKAKEVFGEDFDTNEQTPQGKFFRINAASESKLCEIAEQVYYSIFPSTATGISLDRACGFVNLSRESARHAAHMIRVYGKNGYVIPSGTLFKNPAGIEFYNSAAVTINNSEPATQVDGTLYYADFTVYCTQSGAVGNVQNINSTVAVNTNINQIVYLSVVAYGSDTESDPDLRAKFDTVVQGLGTNTEAAIVANVLRVPGVNDVIVIDNNTGSDMVISDDLTVASRTYAVIVYADDTSISTEVANAIFERRPLGIVQSGLESVVITDDSGTEHTMRFTYVSSKPINIEIQCNVDDAFPAGGIDAVKESVSKYINGLGIGEEVVYSQLYNYIYDVTGVYKVTSLKINNGTADIPINRIEIARTGTITVTTTEV